MDINAQAHLLPVVVVANMITIGMELTRVQFQAFAEAPRPVLLGTLVHTASFPLIAVGLVLLLQLVEVPVSDATVIGILLIAACPSGGFSNVLALIARANLPLSVTLTFISSLLSFVTVPLLIAGFANLVTDLDQPIELPVATILGQLVALVLLPVGVGMFVRHKLPRWVDQNLRNLQRWGQIALYLVIAIIIAQGFDVLVAGLGEALPLSVLLCVGSIGLCYGGAAIFGLNQEDRVTVALEGSIRNLAIALLIAVSALERMDIAVLPTVYFMAVMMVALLFAKTWRRWL